MPRIDRSNLRLETSGVCGGCAAAGGGVLVEDEVAVMPVNDDVRLLTAPVRVLPLGGVASSGDDEAECPSGLGDAGGDPMPPSPPGLCG